MLRNKNRVYMGFLARNPGSAYHMVILVMPKGAAPSDQTTWRLHALNRPDPSRAAGERWDYEAGEIESRPSRLLALALLGKTKTDGQIIAELAKKVELKQDDDSWNCKSWVFDAIHYLRKEGILPPGNAPDALYEVGVRMASEFSKIPIDERMTRAVPTCGANGESIPSEVR